MVKESSIKHKHLSCSAVQKWKQMNIFYLHVISHGPFGWESQIGGEYMVYYKIIVVVTSFILGWKDLLKRKRKVKLWNMILICVIWSLWYERNKINFENCTSNLQKILKLIKLRVGHGQRRCQGKKNCPTMIFCIIQLQSYIDLCFASEDQPMLYTGDMKFWVLGCKCLIDKLLFEAAQWKITSSVLQNVFTSL